MALDHRSAEIAMQAALEALGFTGDPELQGTAARVVGWLADHRPAGPPPPPSLFPAPGADLVQLGELPFHSVCAHHLLPFFGQAWVAYLPGEQVFGLGSVPRALQHLAAQPQLQERLGAQLAEHLLEAGGARAVAVRLRARHLCMEMRGAQSPGTVTTLAYRGAESPALRALLGHG